MKKQILILFLFTCIKINLIGSVLIEPVPHMGNVAFVGNCSTECTNPDDGTYSYNGIDIPCWNNNQMPCGT